MNYLQYILVSIILLINMEVYSQDFKLDLYQTKIPYSMNNNTAEIIEKNEITIIKNVQIPDIAIFLPSKRMATGQAVVVCPGGGYWVLAYDLEGLDIAKYLNSIGVAAMVLKYRLPTTGNSKLPHITPLADVQQAMRLVRYNAKKWNISPNKIGVMGFSAGGHLASTLGTHFDYGNKTATDSIAQQSCRPDFMILAYPVISFVDSTAHKGSADALCGKGTSSDLLLTYSSELQVKEDTPPTFFVHADNDSAVPVENSLLLYSALRAKKISAELHILSEGDHGFGLSVGNDHINSWTNCLKLWLKWLNQK